MQFNYEVRILAYLGSYIATISIIFCLYLEKFMFVILHVQYYERLSKVPLSNPSLLL